MNGPLVKHCDGFVLFYDLNVVFVLFEFFFKFLTATAIIMDNQKVFGYILMVLFDIIGLLRFECIQICWLVDSNQMNGNLTNSSIWLNNFEK